MICSFRIAFRRSLAIAGLSIALVVAALARANAQPRTRTFALIGEHDPAGIVYALRYGSDLVKAEQGAEFTLYLAGRGILLFLDVPGRPEGGKAGSVVKTEYANLRPQPRGMKVIACKEHVELIKAKAKWPYVPLMSGINVASCGNNMKKRLLAEGWRPIMGL